MSKEEGNVTFSRSGLAQWLIDTAKQRYPGRIAYYFNASAEDIDLAAKKVWLRPHSLRTPCATRTPRAL